MFTQIKNIFLDIVFPPLCAVCEKTLTTDTKQRGICEDCLTHIPIKNTFTCPTCHARLAENKKVCHKDIPFVLAAATEYANETVQKLIWRLKYERKSHATHPLAHIMLAHMNALDISVSHCIAVPIPLHSSRERERGFNQSALLATAIAQELHIPHITKALTRTKHTAPQAETKNKKERAENIAGCFTARPELVSGENILLIDDVCTSGATLREATQELKKAGAKHVIALVAAQA